MTELTQQRLKELLHYDPETGQFTWKVKTARRIKVGDVAGSPNTKGYLRIMIDKKRYYAHRLAFLYMTGEFPKEGLQVDHIDQVKHDNKWVNLRLATHQDNMRNKTMYKDNTSGCVGVRWRDKYKTWESSINVDGEYIYLGSFKNKDDAIASRKAAEIKSGFHQNHGKQQRQIEPIGQKDETL